MNWQSKILKIVAARTRGHDLPEKIFLSSKEFEEFFKEVEPVYRERYGAIVQQEKATKEGWDNILYAGVAVCCDPALETG